MEGNIGMTSDPHPRMLNEEIFDTIQVPSQNAESLNFSNLDVILNQNNNNQSNNIIQSDVNDVSLTVNDGNEIMDIEYNRDLSSQNEIYITQSNKLMNEENANLPFSEISNNVYFSKETVT